jgi:hypothetical protein
MEHMLLLLKRHAVDEQALKEHIDGLHDRDSPNFHRWLTADEFGAAFGAAAATGRKSLNGSSPMALLSTQQIPVA